MKTNKKEKKITAKTQTTLIYIFHFQESCSGRIVVEIGKGKKTKQK